MLRELLHVLGRFRCQVVPHTRGDKHFPDARERARLAIQLDQRLMVRIEIRADARIDTRWSAARALDLRALAGQAIHVRSRPAEVRDDSGKAGHRVADRLNFAQDRILRTILDDASLVLRDRAKRAAAEAAALNRYGELDHL